MTTEPKIKNPAAVSLGAIGGRSTSPAKLEAVRANGKRGGRPSLRELAERRVDATPTLSQYKAVIMADWPEGAEHWRWVKSAPVDEIVRWVEAGQ